MTAGGFLNIIFYLFKYLPAMLSANDGRMMKTVVSKNFINVLFGSELSPASDKTSKIPMSPKAIDAYIKIRVAIFCMVLLYQLKD